MRVTGQHRIYIVGEDGGDGITGEEEEEEDILYNI